MLRLSGIRIRENISDEEVFFFAAKKKRIQRSDILSWKIVKKSVDARNKNDVHFSYTIDYAVKNEDRYPYLPKVKPQILPEISCNRKSTYRPVIVGSGVNSRTVSQYLGASDGAIIGSSFKKDGKVTNPIDVDRVRELMENVKR